MNAVTHEVVYRPLAGGDAGAHEVVCTCNYRVEATSEAFAKALVGRHEIITKSTK